jgi:hypothetical protein
MKNSEDKPSKGAEEDYIFCTSINKGLSGIIKTTNPPKIVCFCDEDNGKTIVKAMEQYRTEGLREELINRPKIICICGSGRFLKEMHEIEEKLTLEGKIVLMIGVNTKDVARTEDLSKYKPMLDELHLRKIDLADEVFVINVNGYIGESTKNEIAYAFRNKKPIKYLETPKDCHGNIPDDCTNYGHIEGKNCNNCEKYY